MGLISSILGNAGVVQDDKLHSKYGNLLAEGEAFDVGFNVHTNRVSIYDLQAVLAKHVLG